MRGHPLAPVVQTISYMFTHAKKSTAQLTKQLHDADLRGHRGTEVLMTVAVGGLGGLVGSLAGAPGIVAGAVIGAGIGALAALGFDRTLREGESRDQQIEEIEADADRVIESRRSMSSPPATARSAGTDRPGGAREVR